MKRLWVILGALAVFCALSVGTASAAKLVAEDLNWQISVGQTATPGGYIYPTTNAMGIGANEVDTTSTFTTLGWALPQAAFSDSVVIGWLVIYPDTSVAATINATSFTINVDVGGSAANLLNLGTTGAVTFTDFTTTDKIVKIPIYNNFALARGVAGAVGNWGPKMRLRIVPAAGGTFPAARLQLVHWVD